MGRSLGFQIDNVIVTANRRYLYGYGRNMNLVSTRYEYFVFRYVPNIVGDDGRNFGVLLTELPDDRTGTDLERYVGVAFISDLTSFGRFFRSWDDSDRELLLVFIQEMKAKVKSRVDSDEKGLSRALELLCEANSGIVAEGPMPLDATTSPDSELELLFLREVERGELPETNPD